MYVNHSGWNIEHGSFSYNIYINEEKEDYEIHFVDGTVARQCSPFQEVTADWNCDGDRYTQFGAWFTEDGHNSEFWTPQDMVVCLIDAMNGDRSRGNATVKVIPGIELPPKEKRPKLDDRLRQTEQRRMHQDIELNRKMNTLGIRPHNEPWAR